MIRQPSRPPSHEYTVAIGSLMDASPDLENVTVTAGVDVPPLKLVR